MSERPDPVPPSDIVRLFRNFTNAVGKAGMYPAGHSFVTEAIDSLTETLAVTLEARGGLTLGVTPHGILVDGAAIDPLPSQMRQFGQRLHRRNIGTMQFVPGIVRDEVATLIAAVSAADADQTVGRDGLKLPHVRVEPLVYDVLAFSDGGGDDLDDDFWSRLVEAAFGHRLNDGTGAPSAGELADVINSEATTTVDGARRVFEALSSFATALHSRGERAPVSARKRFIALLSALSRPATTRVMGAAPTATIRRRFMRETLEQVPPTLLLQLLESVADADGDPISQHLHWMLAKLAEQEPIESAVAQGDFATEVMGLLERWDGEAPDDLSGDDPRLMVEAVRVIALALELDLVTPAALSAVQYAVERGQLAEVLELIDHPDNGADTRQALADALSAPGLLTDLLEADEPEWELIERVARHSGTAAVAPLLSAIDSSDDRTRRRRLLDLLVSVAPGAEAVLLDAMTGAPWHLVRNILTVLAQLPQVHQAERVVPLLADPDARVRLEALKVLLRQPTLRDRAVTAVLERGEPPLARLALASLNGVCPPSLVAPILTALRIDDADVRLHAVRLLDASDSPLVVEPLLELVRMRGGVIRRWKLRSADPVMREALGVLARRWPHHRQVDVTLALARRSTDPAIRAVLGGHAGE